MFMRVAWAAYLLATSLLCIGADVKGDAVGGGGRVSSERSVLYGPGLNRRIVTPARYLFVQAVDLDGRNFTVSAGLLLASL